MQLVPLPTGCANEVTGCELGVASKKGTIGRTLFLVRVQNCPKLSRVAPILESLLFVITSLCAVHLTRNMSDSL